MKSVWMIAFLMALTAISFSIFSQDLYDPKLTGNVNERLISAVSAGQLSKQCIKNCTEYLKKNCAKCLKRKQTCIECDADRQKCKQSQKDFCHTCKMMNMEDCERCNNEGVKCLLYEEGINELIDELGADINYPAGCWTGDTPLIEAIDVTDYNTSRNAIVEEIGYTIIRADGIRRLPQSEIDSLIANGGIIKKRAVKVPDVKKDDEKREKVIRLLLDKGADPNATSCFFGVGPLMTSVIKSDLKVTRWLLEAGADPNGKICRKNRGYKDICFRLDKTPLMEVADKGDATIVKLLIKFGAVRSLKDSKGHTARDWAILNGHNEISNLLK